MRPRSGSRSRFEGSERSLTSFGMTPFSGLAHCANLSNSVIPNEVRDPCLTGEPCREGGPVSAG